MRVCLVFGLVFAFFSAVAGHFFGGHDGMAVGTGGHAEAGFDQTGLPGISFFSPTVLATFRDGIRRVWPGSTRIPATHSVWVSAPMSTCAGGHRGSSLFWFFNMVFEKTQSSSESRQSPS